MRIETEIEVDILCDFIYYRDKMKNRLVKTSRLVLKCKGQKYLTVKY